MKKVTAVYTFTQPYTTTTGNKEATISLEINYIHDMYSIYPDSSACSRREFKFLNQRNPKMWRAILTAMGEAIEFAEQSLQNNK